MPVAIITGASRGLGKALAAELVRRDWWVVLDARNEAELAAAAGEMRARAGSGGVAVVAGDVTDPAHRKALVAAADELSARGEGELELLVNNASTLGVSPLPYLAEYPTAALADVFDTNVTAPIALIQEALPLLERSAQPKIVNVTSDASVEHYEGWGGYGASKAALDHISLTLAAETPTVAFYAIDPGDMRTQMHQDAFPGEDISDRPLPEEAAVPGLIALIEGTVPSGRYKAAALGTEGAEQ
jgi:NAD(P)-dependent dehydrogenase (short-subunit alcohol dehydrogenase family)